MEVSERITWETCPMCGHSAAVGWSSAEPVEFDCVKGCHITAVDAEVLGVDHRGDDPRV
jgi:hypothetical protein